MTIFKSKVERNNSHPGPQKPIKTNWLGTASLQILIIIAMLIAIHAFIAVNKDLINVYMGFGGLLSSDIFKLKIINLDGAMALFIGLLGIAAVRYQIAYAMKPYLIYHGTPSDKSEKTLGDRKIWRVTLENIGSGIAVIEKIEYRIAKDKTNYSDMYTLSYNNILQELRNYDIQPGKDIYLSHFSMGGTIGSGKTVLVVEIPVDIIESKIDLLDIKIEFKGVMGDKFRKEIYCIPRGGIDIFVPKTTLQVANPQFSKILKKGLLLLFFAGIFSRRSAR